MSLERLRHQPSLPQWSHLLMKTLMSWLRIFSTFAFIFSFSATSSSATFETASTRTLAPKIFKGNENKLLIATFLAWYNYTLTVPPSIATIFSNDILWQATNLTSYIHQQNNGWLERHNAGQLSSTFFTQLNVMTKIQMRTIKKQLCFSFADYFSDNITNIGQTITAKLQSHAAFFQILGPVLSQLLPVTP